MRNLFIITALALSLFSNAQKMSKEFLEGNGDQKQLKLHLQEQTKKILK